MELLQLEYFYKIALSKTITQAAAELHVSQPSLSRMIRSLEKEFDTKLFNREGRHLRLNENGQIFFRHTTNILNSIEALKMELIDYKKREDLHLSVAFYAVSKLIPQIVQGFKAQYPDIKLQIIQHRSEENLEHNEYDLAIFSTTERLDKSNVQPLLEEEIFIALPFDHPLTKKAAVHLNDLKDFEFVSLSKGKALRDIMDLYCALAGFIPNIILESDDPATVRALIHSGFGISFMPQKTWREISDNSISLVPISQPHCMRYINLTWHKTRCTSAAVALFKMYIIKFFSDLDICD